jgi:uncharacterized protein (UPF0332 family)
MPFDPCLLLSLSSALSEDLNYENESKYRTSISRAYYAAFLVSRGYLESAGYSFPPDSNVHKNVIKYMEDKDSLIGAILFKLRRNRNNADYNLNIQIEKGIVISSIKSAQMIIDKVRKL